MYISAVNYIVVDGNELGLASIFCLYADPSGLPSGAAVFFVETPPAYHDDGLAVARRAENCFWKYNNTKKQIC